MESESAMTSKPAARTPKRKIAWMPMDSAPRNGTFVIGQRAYIERSSGRLRYETHKTWWGKTSHVPLYGWNYGRDVEDLDLWEPERWREIEAHQ